MKTATQFIGAPVTIKVDRRLGSLHPEWGFIHSLNYGYLPGAIAPDGEELDAYLLGVFEPVEEFTGRCIAVIQRGDDSDDKRAVVPEGVSYSNEQILALTEFIERHFQSKVVR